MQIIQIYFNTIFSFRSCSYRICLDREVIVIESPVDDRDRLIARRNPTPAENARANLLMLQRANAIAQLEREEEDGVHPYESDIVTTHPSVYRSRVLSSSQQFLNVPASYNHNDNNYNRLDQNVLIATVDTTGVRPRPRPAGSLNGQHCDTQLPSYEEATRRHPMSSMNCFQTTAEITNARSNVHIGSYGNVSGDVGTATQDPSGVIVEVSNA